MTYKIPLGRAAALFHDVIRVCESGILEDALENPDSLERRVSSPIGLSALRAGLIGRETGRMEVSAAGRLASRRHPLSMRDHLMFVASVFAPCYERGTAVLQDGADNFARTHGTRYFEWLARNPDMESLAHRAMLATQRPVEQWIARSFPFGDCRWMVDVGGGAGGLASEVKRKWPRIRVTVADIDPGAPRVEMSAAEAGVEFVVADFFRALPADADLYVLKLVLHDWSDLEAESILRTVRRSIRDTGRLLVVESAMPPLGEPTVSCLWDLHQMVAMNGVERTSDELCRIAACSGFEVRERIPAIPPFSMFVLHPV